MKSGLSLHEKISLIFPSGAVNLVKASIVTEKVKVKIRGPRSSKTGDYSPPRPGKGHQITLNGDLNPFEMLVTFLHELAHLKTFNENPYGNYSGRIKPHGEEWKKNFKQVLQPYFHQVIFPDQISVVLRNYLHNPAASTCSSPDLKRALMQAGGKTTVMAEEITKETPFETSNGLKLEMVKKLRKNFLCREIQTGKLYIVPPALEIKIL